MEIKKSIEELVEETFEEFYKTVDRYGRGLRIISDTNTTGIIRILARILE